MMRRGGAEPGPAPRRPHLRQAEGVALQRVGAVACVRRADKRPGGGPDNDVRVDVELPQRLGGGTAGKTRGGGTR